jgi:hypothetical protein
VSLAALLFTHVLLTWTGTGNPKLPACTAGKRPCLDHYTLRKNGVWVTNLPIGTLKTQQPYAKGAKWTLWLAAKDAYGTTVWSTAATWVSR